VNSCAKLVDDDDLAMTLLHPKREAALFFKRRHPLK
jgi:hypothetical protein